MTTQAMDDAEFAVRQVLEWSPQAPTGFASLKQAIQEYFKQRDLTPLVTVTMNAEQYAEQLDKEAKGFQAILDFEERMRQMYARQLEGIEPSAETSMKCTAILHMVARSAWARSGNPRITAEQATAMKDSIEALEKLFAPHIKWKPAVIIHAELAAPIDLQTKAPTAVPASCTVYVEHSKGEDGNNALEFFDTEHEAREFVNDLFADGTFTVDNTDWEIRLGVMQPTHFLALDDEGNLMFESVHRPDIDSDPNHW